MTVTTVLYPVSDLAAAKALVGILAGTPTVDSPYCVGYQFGDLHVGLAPRCDGDDGPVAFWDVDDISGTLDDLTAAGAFVAQSPTEVGGGLLVAVVTDADGNRIGLRHLPS